MKKVTPSVGSCIDPVPQSAYPSLSPHPGTQPVLPAYWTCQAVLHPFSPIQSNSTDADKASPFFEICIATIDYAEGIGMNACLLGSSGRKWWYKITPSQTSVSTDGVIYTPVDLGWTLPGTNWFGSASSAAGCAGISYLNWMQAQEVAWWKIPVAIPGQDQKAATWMWFDTTANLPVRLMFGQGPASSPTMGDPQQLALLQMFSFSYFSSFEPLTTSPIHASSAAPDVEGFGFGNPNGYQLFDWNTNFGMTAFMTPVNEKYNPLPTRVLYRWAPDSPYRLSTDRSQHTLMQNTYNMPSDMTAQVALLTGPAPDGMTPPPNSGAGFIINYDGDEVTHCAGFANFPFPQEPPSWVQIPPVDGKIHATIVDNPTLGPGHTITIVGVHFPPSGDHYPDSTYLWTWYSPMNPSGSSSRPVTFMQSQSGVSKGTSLALADYFYYDAFVDQIPACNFDVPPADFTIAAKQKWQPTGITIQSNTEAQISYKSGLWTANPNDNGGQLYDAAGNPHFIPAKSGYTMEGADEGALIGRVGSTVFLIGHGATTPPGAVGALELCINDDLNGEYGAGFSDNVGEVNVAIAVGFSSNT